jgi:glutathione S-transferase
MELILHHYTGSPFAEKICTLLGYKGLGWRSVAIPPILPRPLLEPLVAGYRRTPVLQVGAHVYCDTRCIAAFLERTFPMPTLHPHGSRFVSDMLTRWVEPRLFVAMAPLRFRSAEDVDGVFAGALDAGSFVRDRAPFMRGALEVERVPELEPAAWDQVRLFLSTLDSALASSDAYLAGPHPSLADFAAYHLVWWLEREPRVDGVLAPWPSIRRWLETLRSIGHGQMKPISGEEALERARCDDPSIEPTDLDGEPFARSVGRMLRISADDYGRDSVVGELAASSFDEVVLRREHPEVGTVLLHFPRIGFEILPA